MRDQKRKNGLPLFLIQDTDPAAKFDRITYHRISLCQIRFYLPIISVQIQIPTPNVMKILRRCAADAQHLLCRIPHHADDPAISRAGIAAVLPTVPSKTLSAVKDMIQVKIPDPRDFYIRAAAVYFQSRQRSPGDLIIPCHYTTSLISSSRRLTLKAVISSILSATVFWNKRAHFGRSSCSFIESRI